MNQFFSLFVLATMLLINYNVAQAQDTARIHVAIDSSQPRELSEVLPTRCGSNVPRVMLLPRASVGVQKTMFAELGITRLKVITGCTGYATKAWYSSVEWSNIGASKGDKNLFGLKAGYERNFWLLATALETKYLTDFNNGSLMLTPRAGFGYFGLVNIFYSYNIFINKTPFTSIGHHQVSLVWNVGMSKGL